MVLGGLLLAATAAVLVEPSLIDEVRSRLVPAGAAPKTPPPRIVPVGTVAARRADVDVSIDSLGSVVPLASVTIRSRVDGELVTVAFSEGQDVAEGDVLAEIDQRPFKVRLRQAEGQLARDEAALEAARRGAEEILEEHMESALATTVLGRERRSAVVSERDRRIVAWHEAGHAVAALLLEDADDPVQVSIIPRGGTGGATWMTGNEHDLVTRNQANARLVVALAGRAAEELLLEGDYTQGAHGDLAMATQLATGMIARYGMGRRLVSRSDEKLVFDGPVGQRGAPPAARRRRPPRLHPRLLGHPHQPERATFPYRQRHSLQPRRSRRQLCRPVRHVRVVGTPLAVPPRFCAAASSARWSTIRRR